MASAILSDVPGKSSEIDSLTRRINDLTEAVDFWNRWMLWGLVIAAGAAIWIVVSRERWGALSPAAAAYREALKDEGIPVKLLVLEGNESKTAPNVIRINIGKRE